MSETGKILPHTLLTNSSNMRSSSLDKNVKIKAERWILKERRGVVFCFGKGGEEKQGVYLQGVQTDNAARRSHA